MHSFRDEVAGWGVTPQGSPRRLGFTDILVAAPKPGYLAVRASAPDRRRKHSVSMTAQNVTILFVLAIGAGFFALSVQRLGIHGRARRRAMIAGVFPRFSFEHLP